MTPKRKLVLLVILIAMLMTLACGLTDDDDTTDGDKATDTYPIIQYGIDRADQQDNYQPAPERADPVWTPPEPDEDTE